MSFHFHNTCSQKLSWHMFQLQFDDIKLIDLILLDIIIAWVRELYENKPAAALWKIPTINITKKFFPIQLA